MVLFGNRVRPLFRCVPYSFVNDNKFYFNDVDYVHYFSYGNIKTVALQLLSQRDRLLLQFKIISLIRTDLLLLG
jgi:hypothetical protein